jgi:hypothetical protein
MKPRFPANLILGDAEGGASRRSLNCENDASLYFGARPMTCHDIPPHYPAQRRSLHRLPRTEGHRQRRGIYPAEAQGQQAQYRRFQQDSSAEGGKPVMAMGPPG